MQGCPSCGARTREGASFCGACGTSLAAEMPCPGCRELQPVGQRFCDECGAPLGGPVAQGGGGGSTERGALDRARRVVLRLLATSSEGGRPPLGRDAELDELRGAVDEAIAGRGQIVMVAGEAGTGTTCVATEVERYAALRGALVLWGRAVDGEGAPAYWLWIQIVAGLRSQIADLPPVREPDADQSRVELFDAVSTFLRDASTSRPLVLVLEDLHLADTPSLQLLHFLARELPASRLLVVATYR